MHTSGPLRLATNLSRKFNGVSRTARGCADGNSGLVPPSPAIRPTTGTTTRGYARWLAHANMKELRFSAADGEWRVAFAFDPKRKAMLLVAGDKSGGSEKRFYRELIRKADH